LRVNAITALLRAWADEIEGSLPDVSATSGSSSATTTAAGTIGGMGSTASGAVPKAADTGFGLLGSDPLVPLHGFAVAAGGLSVLAFPLKKRLPGLARRSHRS
jgi:hypothetical protein